jgi:tRNA threonylcarbamoyladenosine biosynthesis protein TsaE
VTVVEWDCGLVERLADAHLLVRLERADDLEERTAVLEPSGGSWADRPAGISARS